jgi:PleD family two-component response regulator
VTIERNGAEGDSPLVLIANDQEWTARAIESILAANSYRVLRTFTARETLELARVVDPDLVILDQQLPDFSGVEVCRQLRSDPRFGAALPILVTTAGPSGRQQRLAANAAGAWEFFGQPLDAEALLHKISVYLASYREVKRLRHGTLIDYATGLYSRAGLSRRASEVLSEARRAGSAVACIGWSLSGAIDVESLERAASVLRVQGRAADAYGRLSSGEFAVVAPNTSASGAERLAERVHEIFMRLTAEDAAAVRTTIVTLDGPAEMTTDGEHLLDRLTHALAA